VAGCQGLQLKFKEMLPQSPSEDNLQCKHKSNKHGCGHSRLFNTTTHQPRRIAQMLCTKARYKAFAIGNSF
jgi:hypothetical protein